MTDPFTSVPRRLAGAALAIALVTWSLAATRGSAHAGAPPARVALIVGANAAAPGRQPLLYAHEDAARMAAVLVTVGRFERSAVTVMNDPSPDVLLATLDRQIAAIAARPESMLYFYYSGHADDGAVYPGGQRLALERVRAALDRANVTVKVGMVDACRGGGWTRAKGMAAEPPFAVPLPMALASEGSVLISSSSGVESAHESQHLQGSFFTYHFTAGLLGAADRSSDGEVTLSEAFDYAKERTIRDTLLHARETQHPSYSVNLRGRRDLVLATVAASPSTVEVAQRRGPLEIIHAATGLQLLELPAGARRIKLAVPPGKYLVRRSGVGGHHVKELTVAVGSGNRIDEDELTLVALPSLAVKGGSDFEPRTRSATPRRLGLTVDFALGPSVSFARWWQGDVAPAVLVNPRLGVTERLTWRIGTLGFAYRLGERHSWEIVPVGGLLGYEYTSPWALRAGVGVGARVWLSPTHGLVGHVQADHVRPIEDPEHHVSASYAHASAGYALAIGDRLTATFAVAGRHMIDADPFGRRDWMVGIGGLAQLGMRRLPLLEMHISDRFSLELHASAEYRFDDDWRGDGLQAPMRPGPGGNVPFVAQLKKWTFPILIGFAFAL